MSTTGLTGEVREMLAHPNPCVMATLRRDGSPVTVATWYLLDGDHILLNLDAGRVRLRHLEHDPRVALTVLSAQSWYTHCSLQGRVETITDDPELAGIDKLARHYTGAPYAVRDRPRVDVTVRIDRVHTWGELGSAG